MTNIQSTMIAPFGLTIDSNIHFLLCPSGKIQIYVLIRNTFVMLLFWCTYVIFFFTSAVSVRFLVKDRLFWMLKFKLDTRQPQEWRGKMLEIWKEISNQILFRFDHNPWCYCDLRKSFNHYVSYFRAGPSFTLFFWTSYTYPSLSSIVKKKLSIDC